jgi:hypothetical protein
MSNFLQQAKPLMISRETRHIVSRKERDKLQDYSDLGIADDNHAWRIMLTLEDIDECCNSPQVDDDASGDLVHFYEKLMANGVWAYIKIKIKIRSGTLKCVAISIHPVEKGPRKFLRPCKDERIKGAVNYEIL